MSLKEQYAEQLVPVITIPLIVLAVAVGLLALRNAIELVGKPFPGLFYYKNLVVSLYQPAGWSEGGDAPRLYDVITAVEGTPVRGADEFKRLFDENASKGRVRITVLRGGEKLDFFVTSRLFTAGDLLLAFFFPFALGLLFVAIGSLVYYARPTKATLINFLMMLLVALSYLTMFDASTTHTFSWLWLIYPLFGALSVHLFLLFPEESRFVERHHWVCYLPYLPALALIVLRYVYENDAPVSIALSKASILFMSLVFVFDLVLLYRSYRSAREGVIKQRAKIAAFALVVAALLPIVWSLLYTMWRPFLGVEFAIGLAVIFPLLIGYAATKRRFFDIDAVIKKGITYGLVSAAVVVLYLVVVGVVTLLMQRILSFESSPTVYVVSTLIVAVAFDPLRRGIQHVIDRSFFRDRLRLQRGFLDLSHRIGTEVFDVDEMAHLVVRELRELPRLDCACLFLRDSEGSYLLHSADPPVEGRVLLGGRRLAAGRLTEGVSAVLDELRIGEDIDRQDAERLEALGVRYLFPMVTKSGLIGLLALGERENRLPLSGEEREIIESIAHQTAVSVENKWLYEERAMDERLTTLGKVSSMIIHEIKNPLGVIRVSAGTLKRRLEHHDNEATELAGFIEEEVKRMDGTVRKFLAYVKSERPQAEWVDVNGIVERAVEGLRTELARHRLELRLSPEGAGVVADTDHLYQVLVNLLLNARDATPPGGRIIVATRPWPSRLVITVADTGCGLEKDGQHSIFKPFYSNKRGGVGLGLTIAQQIVHSHGGSIRVRSRPGAGTVFRIAFPRND